MLHLDTRLSAVRLALSPSDMENLCVVVGCFDAALKDEAVCSAICTHISGLQPPQACFPHIVHGFSGTQYLANVD